MAYQLRRLGPSDLTLLQQIGRASYLPYYPHVWHAGGLEWYLEKCFNAATLTAELADPKVEYLLATDHAEQNVGFLKLMPGHPPPDDLDYSALFLEKIYLLPAYFGQGAGGALLAWVEEKARSLHQQLIWLQVMRTGPVKAYEKAGFRILGPTRFEYPLLLETERDGWVMGKYL